VAAGETQPEPGAVVSALSFVPSPAAGALLSSIRDQRHALAVLVELESRAEATYFAALSTVQEPEVIRTAAQIMACEAQHWSLLTGLLHHGQVKATVPHPFVRGSLQLGPS
jgi:hypothetical protein